jgi:hypothetical protein
VLTDSAGNDVLSESGGVVSLENTKIVNVGTSTAASGTSVTFTGIPSTARIVYVVFEDVSKGAENMLLQLGTSSGVVTSGYSFRTAYAGGSNVASSTSSSSGFVTAGAGGDTTYISGTFSIYNIRDYVYVGTLTGGRLEAAYGFSGGGDVDLGGQLTQVKLSNTSGGSFDNGYFNVMWV